MIHRDTTGRVRQEHTIGAGTQKPAPVPTFVSIVDPGELVVLFTDSGTKETVKLDVGQVLREEVGTSTGATCPLDPESQSESSLSRELLGTRIIEGFLCHGIRVTMGQEISEHWLSGDLAMLLYENTKSPDCQVTYRVFNIILGEPEGGPFVSTTS
jgi:hypothetical protein